jgi:type I restriction-modification system DNA methylase subunit
MDVPSPQSVIAGPPPSNATVTASGIAKMAHVGRAAVSNWRRRYADFPAPVGGSAGSPDFDAEAVERWLERHGKSRAASTEERLWRLLERFTPAGQIGDALCAIGAFLLAGREAKGHRPPTPQQLLAGLRGRDARMSALLKMLLPKAWSAQHEEMFRVAAELVSEQEPLEAFEYLHSRYVNSARSLSASDATPDLVAEIMLALAGQGRKLFDFTSGTGSILRVAAKQALDDGRSVACFAQEVKPQHAATTMLRLWFVHERAAKVGLNPEPPVVYCGDSLLDDAFHELVADVVVTNPPFGIHDWGHERLAYDSRWEYGLPPRTEPELAWVQHALAHLAPGGTAVLVMPPAAASRSAGRRIRGELVRRGALQAVIALPAGMMAPASIGLHLWVLTRPSSETVTVPGILFVDGSGQSSPGGRSRPPKDQRELSSHAAQVVQKAWRAYRSGRKGAASASDAWRIMRAIEVLDAEVDLTPARYLPVAASTARPPREVQAAAKEFDGLIQALQDSLPRVRPTPPVGKAEARRVEIVDLIRSGAVSVHRAVGRSRTASDGPRDTAEVSVLTGQDVLAGCGPTGLAAATADARVQSGDILVPVVARQVVARVATPIQIGAYLGPGVHAIRVDPDVFDPWFVAGVLSRTDSARASARVSTATGIMRIDLKRLSVPVLPIQTQRRYGEAFRKLAEFRQSLARLVEHGEELARDMADGLAAGELAVGPG